MGLKNENTLLDAKKIFAQQTGVVKYKYFFALLKKEYPYN
jgi:hypothetical protein